MENIGRINLKRDLQEITTFIQEYIDATYLSEIHNQINTYKRQCKEAPCKEVELLKAVIPFIEGENKDKISSLIDTLTYSQMIQTMLPHYSQKTLFARENENEAYDNVHQVILVLFLYKAILWAEQYKTTT